MFFRNIIQSFQSCFPRPGRLWLGCFLTFFTLAGQAQEMQLTVMAKRALADARYEQHMRLLTPDDELDYWTDQRNFEAALEKRFFQGYQTYIITKRSAYRDHMNDCASACGHGDYYELQAAYYLQIAESDRVSTQVNIYEMPK